MRELLYAVRRLRGSPMFTIAATLTLALAIGATASVFGLVDAVLLKAFPYRNADRVLRLWESNSEQHQPQVLVSTPDYFDWVAQNRSFTGIAAACCGDFLRLTIAGSDGAERVVGLAVTPNYFQVMGLSPILGRTIAADTTAQPEVVLGYGYWQRRFAGDRSILGQTLTIDNPNDARPMRRHSYTIVGILPPGVPGQVEIWTGIFFEPGEDTARTGRYLDVYARLKPGVAQTAGDGDLRTIAARMAVTFPKTNGNWSVASAPLLDTLIGPVRWALLALLAAAGSVLVIGVANLANLFLVRYLSRERELALRTALGATRGRLVRDLALEAAVLGLGAGTLGLGLAVLGVHALRALAPPTLPRLADVGFDAQVAVFCLAISLGTVLVFGVLPAWQISRNSLADVIKEGGRATGSAQRQRLQNGLVVLQIGVALILLTSAGLLVESFARFERMDPGFRPAGVVAAQIAFTAEQYPTAERQEQFLKTLIERLSAQPGVDAASVSWGVPAWATTPGGPFAIVGDPPVDLGHLPKAVLDGVSPDYLRTFGIRLLRGRGILPTDDVRAMQVAVVDETMVRRYFADRDPIGERLILSADWHPDTVTVVGVVASVKNGGLAVDDQPTIYTSNAQHLGGRAVQVFVAVRTRGDPALEGPIIRRFVASLDPLVPVSDVKTMTDRLNQSIGTTRFSTFLASLFAVLAVVLGAFGIYSVLAYIVSQRRREIAVRIALGARARDVMSDVLRRALALASLGIALGAGVTWVVTRALASLFVGVSPHDPMIFAGSAVVFALVALAAASIPAFRTTRVNPVVALTST